ncbi:MAG: nitronate monooxygenase [Moraxella sp.]|uniref:NAD(P)H-dependent flavin oxidoreductase n=1 Tax=Moraxella sp. TaxID=479 RepID=UPI0026DCFBB2|nr:nitronate monooxygenase [Moraxella sp.]MDO4450899.1 nitronate monooxygenase [Moraxella sp.]
MMTLQTRLNLTTPIVQAPMAGASNADFVIHACKLGVLGSLGAGMMSPAQIHDEINKIKAGTDKAFNINLMILNKNLTTHYSESMPQWLTDLYDELGIVPKLDERPAYDFDEQFAVLLDNPVPVASFTFGILTKEQVEALHGVGSLVIGTANTPDEVMAWQAVGADAVVVQGVEAGGHQGGWLGGEKFSALDLLKLAKAKSTLPLISAGGIANREQVQTMLDNGADMVAVGTAFLTTTESPTNPLWKDRLLNATGEDTRLTKLYSGKWARGVVTDYMNRFAHLDNDDLPIYPTFNAMTKPLRAYGATTQNTDFMSLWCGVGVADCHDESMSELVGRLA